MANQSFTAYFNAIAYGNGKNMAALINSHASQKIQIARVGLLNAQTGAITGVLAELILRLYTAGGVSLTAPTAITPTPHDSLNTGSLSLVCGHAGTIAGTPQVLRRIMWSTDEAAVSTLSNDELECVVPWNVIWDAGYGDTSVQFLTLNQTQMMALVCNTNTVVGTLDTWVEYMNV